MKDSYANNENNKYTLNEEITSEEDLISKDDNIYCEYVFDTDIENDIGIEKNKSNTICKMIPPIKLEILNWFDDGLIAYSISSYFNYTSKIFTKNVYKNNVVNVVGLLQELRDEDWKDILGRFTLKDLLEENYNDIFSNLSKYLYCFEFCNDKPTGEKTNFIFKENSSWKNKKYLINIVTVTDLFIQSVATPTNKTENQIDSISINDEQEYPYIVAVEQSTNDEIEHGKFSYLNKLVGAKLPIVKNNLNDITFAKKTLIKKYPWLNNLTEYVFVKMEVFCSLNKDKTTPVFFDPILLLGPPGIGKTAWACDFSELLGVPKLIIPLAGKSTAVGFRSSEAEYKNANPSPIMELLARHLIANPLIVLDEIDKIGSSKNHGNVQDSALHFMDPTSNNSLFDDFFKSEVNMSKVMWICTANNINDITSPLLDRLDVLKVYSPNSNHAEIITENILGEIEKNIPVSINEIVSYKNNLKEILLQVVSNGIEKNESLRTIERDTIKKFNEVILDRKLLSFYKEEKHIGFTL